MLDDTSLISTVKLVCIDELKPHPRNYREHPPDQIAQIAHSIRQHGFYRNIVVATDMTILAGHGVVSAARSMGLTTVPVLRLPLAPDDVRALKLLTGDNELGHLGELDDRLLSQLLLEIKDIDVDGLLGTGYDAAMLANLIYVTRPRSEIGDFDAAAEWVGMPEHVPQPTGPKLVLTFETLEARDAFCRGHGLPTSKAKVLGSFYPPKKKGRLENLRIVADDADDET